MEYLEVTQNYYISDFTIINLYNEYLAKDGFKVINIEQERADKCKFAVGPQDRPRSSLKLVTTNIACSG